MKILVAVKRVIDYNVQIRVKEDGSGVHTDNVKMSTNPPDDNATEESVKLKESGKIVRHIIIGDGEQREYLESLIKKYRLEEQVFLTGPIHEAAGLLKAFDIFILPSRSEALAYAVVEAAQAGLPIIASRVGGIPEIITDNKEGTLIPEGHSEALSSASKVYLTNKSLAHTHAIAAQVKSQQFSIKNMVKSTIEQYER